MKKCIKGKVLKIVDEKLKMIVVICIVLLTLSILLSILMDICIVATALCMYLIFNYKMAIDTKILC